MKLITSLALAACLLATPLRAASSETQVTLLDNQGYPAGSYMAYVSAWGKGAYVQGVDYTESITLKQSAFPGGVTINSNWPDKPCAAVCGFIAVDFGDYAGTVVPAPIPSRPIKNIAALRDAHHFSLAGQTDGFDVIDDLFLTSGPGSKTTHLFEVEVFLHTPPYSASYVGSVKPIGTFTGSGTSWTVAVSPGTVPDILFMPANQADMASGAIDLKAMLDWLVANGVLTGNEYFNGLGIGVETRQGSGSMLLHAFAVTYR